MIKYYLISILVLFGFKGYSQTISSSISEKVIHNTINDTIYYHLDSTNQKGLALIYAENFKSKETNLLENISANWIPILSFLVAIVTIFFGWRTIQHNRKIKLYELIINLTNEYSSIEMLAAFLCIDNWKNAHQDNFLTEYGNLLQNDYPKVQELDKARRKIAHYYNRIYLLAETQIVNEQEITKLVSEGETDFLFKFIEPLENVKNSNYNKDMYNMYRRIEINRKKK